MAKVIVLTMDNMGTSYRGCNAGCRVIPTGEDEFEEYTETYACVFTSFSAAIPVTEDLIPYLRNEVAGDSRSNFTSVPNEDFVFPKLIDGGGVLIDYSSTRNLDTVYQISSNRDAHVIYSVSINATLLLGGTVFLEVSPNGSTGWQEASRFNLPLGILLNLTMSLSAFVKAGYSIRLRTTGSATKSIVSHQEGIL